MADILAPKTRSLSARRRRQRARQRPSFSCTCQQSSGCTAARRPAAAAPQQRQRASSARLTGLKRGALSANAAASCSASHRARRLRSAYHAAAELRARVPGRGDASARRTGEKSARCMTCACAPPRHDATDRPMRAHARRPIVVTSPSPARAPGACAAAACQLRLARSRDERRSCRWRQASRDGPMAQAGARRRHRCQPFQGAALRVGVRHQ